MEQPDPTLAPDWDEDNVGHIAAHGLRPEQVEEVYYGEGSLPTLALVNRKKRRGLTEYQYRLWGTDGSVLCIEAIVAPYPGFKLWRCVTAFPMSAATRRAYLRKVRP